MTPLELEALILAKIEESLCVSPDETVLGFIEVGEVLQAEFVPTPFGSLALNLNEGSSPWIADAAIVWDAG